MYATYLCTSFALVVGEYNNHITPVNAFEKFKGQTCCNSPVELVENDSNHHQDYSVIGESERTLSNDPDATDADKERKRMSQFPILFGLCRQQFRDAGRRVGDGGGLGQSFTIQGLLGFPGGGKRTVQASER